MAERLIALANDKSGADNISVIVIAGSQFGEARLEASGVNAQHAITRVRPLAAKCQARMNWFWLLAGVVLGLFVALCWTQRAAWTDLLLRQLAGTRP